MQVADKVFLFPVFLDLDRDLRRRAADHRFIGIRLAIVETAHGRPIGRGTTKIPGAYGQRAGTGCRIGIHGRGRDQDCACPIPFSHQRQLFFRPCRGLFGAYIPDIGKVAGGQPQRHQPVGWRNRVPGRKPGIWLIP